MEMPETPPEMQEIRDLLMSKTDLDDGYTIVKGTIKLGKGFYK